VRNILFANMPWLAMSIKDSFCAKTHQILLMGTLLKMWQRREHSLLPLSRAQLTVVNDQ
jgi:hypothetical protein